MGYRLCNQFFLREGCSPWTWFESAISSSLSGRHGFEGDLLLEGVPEGRNAGCPWHSGGGGGGGAFKPLKCTNETGPCHIVRK